METQYFAAFDFGAESGRSVLGTITSEGLAIEEIHRFPNLPIELPSGLHWNTPALYQEILRGLTILGRQRNVRLSGIGIDTWGVDFGLIASDGSLLGLPQHYRDGRTKGAMERLFAVVPREEVFEQTGIQFMEINSLYQLHAMSAARTPALEAAARLLFTPDLFNYWLTGELRAEVSISSTSQLYDPRRRDWSEPLLRAIGIRRELMPELVACGTALGPLLPRIAEGCGLHQPVTVYATAGHDTAAAVAAVPALENERWCYISSGTWSLMGVELEQPLINAGTLAANFTNEAGAGGRTRLLKNIAGLWLLQECRRAWAAEGHEYTYEELVRLASAAAPFAAILNPDALFGPGKMPLKIAAYCERTGQTTPATHGSMARSILESLALSYRRTLEILEKLLGYALPVIHIVGGGTQNPLLNQFAADATGTRVITGPTEATAIGNILVQAMGAGIFSTLEEVREVVRRSFPVNVIEPCRHREDWTLAYRKFQDLLILD